MKNQQQVFIFPDPSREDQRKFVFSKRLLYNMFIRHISFEHEKQTKCIKQIAFYKCGLLTQNLQEKTHYKF